MTCDCREAGGGGGWGAATWGISSGGEGAGGAAAENRETGPEKRRCGRARCWCSSSSVNGSSYCGPQHACFSTCPLWSCYFNQLTRACCGAET